MKKYIDQISKKTWIVISTFLFVMVLGDMATSMFPADPKDSPGGFPIFFSPENTRIQKTIKILTNGQAKDILVTTARGGLLEVAFKIEANKYRLTFSPDGRYLIDGFFGKITKNADTDLTFKTDNCSNVDFFSPFLSRLPYVDKDGKTIDCKE